MKQTLRSELLLLRVQKSEQCLCVVIAESSAYSHVHCNRSRNTGGKSLWSVVAPSAILFKHLLPAILIRRMNVFCGRFGSRRQWRTFGLADGHSTSNGERCCEQEKAKQFNFQVFHRYPPVSHESVAMSSAEESVTNPSMARCFVINRRFTNTGYRCCRRNVSRNSLKFVTGLSPLVMDPGPGFLSKPGPPTQYLA
jgi:hypothetical protein